jgi:MFS family permease
MTTDTTQPHLNPQIWILISGRFISQIGTGFTLFYAPIFFVNQVGLSATEVGIGLGSASILGILGRILSGSLSELPTWGRKRILLLSAMVSAIASFILAATHDFSSFAIGNLLAGFGIGLYWPASEAMVADLTTAERRREAYAWNRLADSLGLQVGIVLGGVVVSTAGNYRLLFIIDAISFLAFWVLMGVTIRETHTPAAKSISIWQGWVKVFRDRLLWIYVLANIIFTTYIAQIHSTLPLYLSNHSGRFAAAVISGLFAWHMALAVMSQLPVAKFLSRFSHARALIVAAWAWGVGFILVWGLGIVQTGQLGWAIAALGMLAFAIVAYTPSASALVAELAPDSLRAVYLSLNSQCWAVGYAIGPILGGWAMDRSDVWVDGFWLVCGMSAIVPMLILAHLDRLTKTML